MCYKGKMESGGVVRLLHDVWPRLNSGQMPSAKTRGVLMSADMRIDVWRSGHRSWFLGRHVGLIEVGGKTNGISMRSKGACNGQRSRRVRRFNVDSSDRSHLLWAGLNVALALERRWPFRGAKGKGEGKGFGWAKVVGIMCVPPCVFVLGFREKKTFRPASGRIQTHVRRVRTTNLGRLRAV